MMPPPSDPYSFQKENSKYYYWEIDAKFANNPRFNTIDITLIKYFLISLGYAGNVITAIKPEEYIKKFIDYLEKKRRRLQKV